MIGKLKHLLIRLNGHRTTEVYVIGFPKTGNTWLRVMLGKYVQLLTGKTGNPLLPLFSSFDVLGRCVRFDPRIPRIQFTHAPLEWSYQKAGDLSIENVVAPYRKKKVIILVRSIPDVLVSHYWQVKTQVNPPYSGDVSQFIRDPVMGVEKVVAFYHLWNEGKKLVPELMLLRYEDVRKHPSDYFRHFLDFLKVPIAEGCLAEAVSFASFENMRKLEVDNLKTRELVYSSSGLPIFATGDVRMTGEAFHVRKGKVGGYGDYLSEDDVSFLKKTMQGRIPKWYGYPDGFWEGTTEGE